MLPPLIKWSGSKRSQAKQIVSYFPSHVNTYYEPFLGGGSVLGFLTPKKAIGGDLYKPLIDIWKAVQKTPGEVVSEYEKRWNFLQKKGYKYFYTVRDNFNKTKNPHDLLFLSRTCVNGLIRFNKNGEFNNSLHHSRKGISPKSFKKVVWGWSKKIPNYHFVSGDYEVITKNVKEGDFVYLDPPYFNTKSRYIESIDYSRFIKFLENLNKKQIKFALSYDGKRGTKSFIVSIPRRLYKKHVLLKSGNAPFRKLQDKKIEPVLESLYLNY
ncbi:MAG: Dam family site-specific DNA-(adenine-N6)-methyltransferase [Candidatus Kerfeldbacteria bacterium]|nr:Dam family site-specific DNA-(adenine-N6)-methyltransferase [Candidatus Kerfeldbacteria bacterium]